MLEACGFLVFWVSYLGVFGFLSCFFWVFFITHFKGPVANFNLRVCTYTHNPIKTIIRASVAIVTSTLYIYNTKTTKEKKGTKKEARDLFGLRASWLCF